MSPRSKREYLAAIVKRYRAASRTLKTVILDEFCSTCGYHRKHALRLLRTFRIFTQKVPAKRGRKPVYDPGVLLIPLKRIWKAANLPCSKRLKAIIPLWLPGYVKTYGPISQETAGALLGISPASLDRILKPVRAQYTNHGRATTKPGTLLRKHIPVKTNQWDEFRPGFLEADTVAHCGSSTEGIYANTLDCVDIATGWTEQRAVWGKNYQDVIDQIKDIERSLPFPILGFDSDNGSEFLNHHLLRYLTENRIRPVQFTRSRAYKKDDNAHIEQKNWTHVRQWLGYDRLDSSALVPLMNNLYTSEWRLFLNFFCPSVKLLEKKRIASKTVKRYDKPKTPYQRVLESPEVSLEAKRQLKEQYKTLNPFDLRKALEEKLKKIFKP
ncbi:MAG: integrase [Nitrospirae bacterium GWC2_57_9]|nr:MAG: integrase [Nitrospirae bacterium GWC2_57_9]